MKRIDKARLEKLGFSYSRGGAHTSRTIMLAELTSLLSHTGLTGSKDDYYRAIVEQNALHKRSTRTRALTYRNLKDLYSLDAIYPVFRALLYFWDRDQAARSLVAILCSYARDPLLRLSANRIVSTPSGHLISRESMEDQLDKSESGRFSPATLKSTAQNVNSSWTKSGHLKGRVKKIRSQAKATPGSTAYALFLGFLTGVRGQALFSTEFTKILDCSPDMAIELAGEASRKGWITMKRIGDVIDLQFPNLITNEELAAADEQS